MLMALCFVSVFDFAGQASMQSAQPVQSSGATCSEYFCVPNCFHFAGADLNPLGAFLRTSLSYTFARMTACGQTRTHLPHCMQSASSHSGISSAMFLFSHCAVPLGKVPSIGNAL